MTGIPESNRGDEVLRDPARAHGLRWMIVASVLLSFVLTGCKTTPRKQTALIPLVFEDGGNPQIGSLADGDLQIVVYPLKSVDAFEDLAREGAAYKKLCERDPKTLEKLQEDLGEETGPMVFRSGSGEPFKKMELEVGADVNSLGFVADFARTRDVGRSGVVLHKPEWAGWEVVIREGDIHKQRRQRRVDEEPEGESETEAAGDGSEGDSEEAPR